MCPMSRRITAVIGSASLALASCGGSGGSGNPPPPPPPPPPTVQYVAPSDSSFVAAIDPANPSTAFLGQLGSYAAPRLYSFGTYTAGSPVLSNPANYAQAYKSGDGHIYKLNLSITGSPAQQQVSSESNATIDDLCSLNGASTPLGTDVNYLAVSFYNDFANPENSAYVYRLPGPDGVCNTADDVIYMVKLGMGSTAAPILVRMPVAVTHDPSSGAIFGYLVNEGTALTFYDSNFQNRSVLLTPATPIQVAYPLGPSLINATGKLIVLDGNIVYVNYPAGSVSASLFSIPNYSATKRFSTAFNETTLYFSVDTSNYATTPVAYTSALYSMPLDGSMAPTQLATESGLIQQIAAPAGGTTIAYSIVPPRGVYTIRTVTPGAAPTVATAIVTTGNTGSFVATAGYIYYTVSTVTAPSSTTRLVANTMTGIVGMDGTPVAQTVASSRFVAEQTNAQNGPWVTVVRARNLTPVTLANTAGITYTEDGISGATLEVIDTATNAVTVTLGTLPQGSVMTGGGSFLAPAGYFDGLNVNSTANPTTRDLFYIDTTMANSLQTLSSNLK
jgi:hypothetical protein